MVKKKIFFKKKILNVGGTTFSRLDISTTSRACNIIPMFLISSLCLANGGKKPAPKHP
jgi:hypothetical protein